MFGRILFGLFGITGKSYISLITNLFPLDTIIVINYREHEHLLKSHTMNVDNILQVFVSFIREIYYNTTYKPNRIKAIHFELSQLPFVGKQRLMWFIFFFSMRMQKAGSIFLP